MLRVIHCIYDDPANPWLGGGGALRVYEVYRRLTDRVAATVVAGRYPGAKDHERDGVEYRYLGRPRPYALSRWSFGRAATRMLREAEYDAAIFDFSVYTPVRMPDDRPVGHVIHMLIGPTAGRRWGRVLGRAVLARERRMLGRARKVSTTSHWMERQLRPILPPDARLSIVRSGVADEFFQVRREEQGYLLYYGRFDLFQKGLDTLMEAFDLIRAARPDLQLHIAGRGRDAGDIRRIVARSDLGTSVQLHADVTRNEVLRLLSGASLLLMPSRFEGLPVVAAEALAAGVPVLATDVGALSEIVTHSQTGLLVPPERPQALANEALRLMADDGTRQRMSQAARVSARRFRWSVVADDHYTFLTEVGGKTHG
jgi:glycosyltransferase involved in cell wall biosynthesis